jgi:hypothetical protein
MESVTVVASSLSLPGLPPLANLPHEYREFDQGVYPDTSSADKEEAGPIDAQAALKMADAILQRHNITSLPTKSSPENSPAQSYTTTNVSLWQVREYRNITVSQYTLMWLIYPLPLI